MIALREVRSSLGCLVMVAIFALSGCIVAPPQGGYGYPVAPASSYYYGSPMSILQQQNAWRQRYGYGGGYFPYGGGYGHFGCCPGGVSGGFSMPIR